MVISLTCDFFLILREVSSGHFFRHARSVITVRLYDQFEQQTVRGAGNNLKVEGHKMRARNNLDVPIHFSVVPIYRDCNPRSLFSMPRDPAGIIDWQKYINVHGKKMSVFIAEPPSVHGE